MDDRIKVAFVFLGLTLLGFFILSYSFAQEHKVPVGLVFQTAVSVAVVCGLAIFLAFVFDIVDAACVWAPMTFISAGPLLREIAIVNADGPQFWNDARDLPWYGSDWFLWSGSVILIVGCVGYLWKRTRY